MNNIVEFPKRKRVEIGVGNAMEFAAAVFSWAGLRKLLRRSVDVVKNDVPAAQALLRKQLGDRVTPTVMRQAEARVARRVARGESVASAVEIVRKWALAQDQPTPPWAA